MRVTAPKGLLELSLQIGDRKILRSLQQRQRIASRNLWISVPCLLLAFCVWMLFSAVAVNLPV